MAGNYPDNKSTKAEVTSRIEQGARWIVQNPDAGFTDFCKWFSKKFSVSERHAATMRKRVFEVLGDDKYNENLEGARRAAVASLQKMLKKTDDVRDQLAIRQEINKITGLYTQKIEVATKEDAPLFKVDLNTGQTTEE